MLISSKEFKKDFLKILKDLNVSLNERSIDYVTLKIDQHIQDIIESFEDNGVKITAKDIFNLLMRKGSPLVECMREFQENK